MADLMLSEVPGRRLIQRVGLTVVAVLALVTTGVVGYAAAGPQPPTDSSVAAGFARDMTDHHAQAVDMATIISQRTHTAEIRTLATDIALTQTNQMGQMQGWLSQWHLSLGRRGPPMAWMISDGSDAMMGGSGSGDHGSPQAIDPALLTLLPDGRMPGLATDAQINQLRTLPPDRADILFLQLMIAHHKAGIAMAQLAITLTDEPVVDRLAASMVSGQQGEITQMTQLLHERGARP